MLLTLSMSFPRPSANIKPTSVSLNMLGSRLKPTKGVRTLGAGDLQLTSVVLLAVLCIFMSTSKT